MNDSDVGKLWRWVLSSVPDEQEVAMEVQANIEKLIIKLIKTRAMLLKVIDNAVCEAGFDAACEQSCRDFGIDYRSFVKAKGDT